MDSHQVFGFSAEGPRTFEDANRLVGILNRVTLKHSQKVDLLIARLEAIGIHDVATTRKIEDEVNKEIEEWHIKVHKLGGRPKGLWHVDIESTEGYYFCWKFPEQSITFWHRWDQGLADRNPIAERVEPSARSHELKTPVQDEAL